ncbi:MAG: hypothetical protein JWO31_2262, partial [Phycisphaerales bacterium]|nr:hypothetical protein [Phycisphaerales bacterium]
RAAGTRGGPPRDPFTNTGDLNAPAAPPPSGPSRRLGTIIAVVALTAVAIAVVWTTLRPPATVRGTLRFEGLSDPRVPADVRRAFQDARLAELSRQSTARAARDALAADGATYGFLDESSTDATARLQTALDKAAWGPGRSEALTVEFPSTNPDADRRPMRALLAAARAAHEAGRRGTGAPADDKRAKAEQESERAENLLYELNNQRKRAARRQAEAQVARGGTEDADALTRKATDLQRQQAASRPALIALRREVERLENLPSRPSAGGGGGAAAAAGVAADEDDAQLKELRSTLAALNENLNATLQASGTAAGDAKAAMDAAQQQFDARVSAARDAAGGNEVLTVYLGKLDAFQKELRQHNDELAQQQSDQRALLDQLRNRLGQETTARVQRAWDTSPELKKLLDRRGIVERQHNVAAANNLPEAARLAADLKGLDKDVAALRDLIAAKDEYDPLTRQFLAFIDDSMKQMDRARRQNERRQTDLFAAFDKARPNLNDLPADQKARTAKVDEAYQALATSRSKYQAAIDQAAARADAAVRQLTQQVAAQRDRVDARKRELADARSAAASKAAGGAAGTGAGSNPIAAADEAARQAALTTKKEELSNAEKDDVKREVDALEAMAAARRAKADADDAAAAARELADLDRQIAAAQVEKGRAQMKASDAAGSDPLAAVRAEPVTDASVTVQTGDDKRWPFTFLATAAGLVGVIVVLAASRPREAYVPPTDRRYTVSGGFAGRRDGQGGYGDHAEHGEHADEAYGAPPQADPFGMPARRAS